MNSFALYTCLILGTSGQCREMTSSRMTKGHPGTTENARKRHACSLPPARRFGRAPLYQSGPSVASFAGLAGLIHLCSRGRRVQTVKAVNGQPGKEGARRRGLIVYFFVSVGAKSSIVNSRRGDAGSWLQGPARKPRLDVDLVICFRNFIRSINRIAHSWTYFYVDPSSVHVQRLRDGACHHAHRPRTPSWASVD